MSAFSTGEKQHALPTYDEKKNGLQPPLPSARSRRGITKLVAKLGLALLLSSLFVWLSARHFSGHLDVAALTGLYNAEGICPQEDPLTPSKYAKLIHELDVLYSTKVFKERAADLLSGAVQIQTVNYDDMGPVGEDPRWDVFDTFHSYLHSKFPLVYASFSPTKINTYGLVYNFEGSDPSLKPILLMAHQDAVPVNEETVSEWKYPPFSGYYDGRYVWGRGASDNKGSLIGVLTTLETLLENGYKPTRTVYVAFGFDEETGGHQGARYIAAFLLETYGENHFALIVDEGSGHEEQYGARFARPAVAEKGAMDVSITVETSGGHSSMPPAHTSIGILSSALVRLESNPYPPTLTRTTPYYSTLLCQAAHAPDMPLPLRTLLLRSVWSDSALDRALDLLLTDDSTRYIQSTLSTTQAITIIDGGVKANALPEYAQAIVNHRVHTDSSTQEVADRLTTYLRPIAKSHNLTFEAFGITDGTGSEGTFRLGDPFDNWVEPAPLTPTNSSAWRLFSGTIRQTYAAGHGDKEIFVAPALMPFNTDTRHFWKLSPHIYRYNHYGTEDFNGLHTINEGLEVAALIEHIRFITYLILNADGEAW